MLLARPAIIPIRVSHLRAWLTFVELAYNPPMPRDPGLEELVHSSLGDPPGLTEKAMFGGWAWLLHGNLLCGARKDSLMLRIGPDNEPWALQLPGVIPVVMRGRRMKGYVRATPDAYAEDAVRQRLIDATLAFTNTLPRK
jgi:hypothetical protein